MDDRGDRAGDVDAVIPAERCVVGWELTEPRLAPGGAVLAYVRAGRESAALILDTLDGAPPRQLTSHPTPGPGRGLGGGCWCWTPSGDAVVYAGVDGALWHQPVPWGGTRRITDHGPDRAAAAPAVLPGGELVAYVLDDAEVWIAPLDGGRAPARLDDGSADFCFDPCPSPSGQEVAWQAWNVPHMPWDGARRQHCSLADGRVTSEVVAAEPSHVQQPRYLPDGRPVHVCDGGGWANVWVGDQALVAEPFEHAGPSWGQGQRSFAVSPDGSRVAFTRNERGFGRLCVADVATGAVVEIARAVHGALSWEGDRLAGIRTGARTPTQVVVYDMGTGARRVVGIGPVSGWEDAPLAEPELVEVPTGDGTVHARIYLADRRTTRFICWLHGGPTDQWQVTFMPRLAYWRARGWNVLVPDHRGSTGHGRAYQQALNGRWGELDVSDGVAAIRHAHARGWGSAAGTVLIGASSGGFTALGIAAAAGDLVAGVAAISPVADLLDLAARSHRFERHATDTLIGPLPQHEQRYRQRSPLTFADRLAGTPLLLLHGDADPVVPVTQSAALAERIRAAGGDVELHVYPGEGHGVRRLEHQLDEYARLGAFLDRCVGDH